MEEWKTYKLADICDLIPGFAFKSADFGDYEDRAIKIGDIQPPYVNYKTTSGLDVHHYTPSKLAKYIVRKGDFVLAMTGATIGKIGRYIHDTPAYLNQRVLLFKPHSSVNSKFVYYSLLSPLFQKYVLNHIDSETAQPNISGKSVSGFEINLPSRKVQDRIADLMSAIDDKIDLNTRINHNLEEQARALYKSWFVDFEPFEKDTDGIPIGWKQVSLSDIMGYSGGSQPPASEFISEPLPGYIRFIQIRDYESDSHITYIPISKRNKLCDENDILIARYGASLGRICYGLKGAYNVALAKVTPVKSYYREFLRCYLSDSSFYEGINLKGNRAVQAGFNQSDINSFKLLFPSDDQVMQHFELRLSVLFSLRQRIAVENKELVAIRETLLPVLMSDKSLLLD